MVQCQLGYQGPEDSRCHLEDSWLGYQCLIDLLPVGTYRSAYVDRNVGTQDDLVSMVDG